MAIKSSLMLPLFFSSLALASSANSPESLNIFFQNLEGKWQCVGESSKGLQTAATITFEQGYGENVYQFTQQGTKGHTNKLVSSWAYSKNLENLVISRHYFLKGDIYYDVYASDKWNANKLTISAKPFIKPLWAENRFTYEFIDKNEFKVTWEVYKEQWKMGDYLDCKRDL